MKTNLIISCVAIVLGVFGIYYTIAIYQCQTFGLWRDLSRLHFETATIACWIMESHPNTFSKKDAEDMCSMVKQTSNLRKVLYDISDEMGVCKNIRIPGFFSLSPKLGSQLLSLDFTGLNQQAHNGENGKGTENNKHSHLADSEQLTHPEPPQED